jgi:hypothetical protein
MSSEAAVRLSAKERQFLRQAVRSHPKVLEQVPRLSDISALTKNSLIQAAVALGINIETAKAGPLEDDRPLWDSVEGREQRRRSDEKPAFVGVIEEPMTFLFAGESATRTLRVSYELTPEWPYVDLEAGSEVRGWEQGSFTYELSARRTYSTVSSDGQGKARQSSSTAAWVNCTDLVCEGVFGRSFEDTVNDRIEEACLRENGIRKSVLEKSTE